MRKKSNLLNKDLYYYYIFLIIGIIFLYSTNKIESFLILNQYRTPILDVLMPYITFLGDGTFVVIITALFLLYRVRYGIFLSLTFLVSGFFVQILKRFVFSEALRPVAYFRELGMDINTIPGIETPLMFSFPSGHSATAFAFFIGISFLVRAWSLKLLLLVIAIIVGYSRIYLAVHFPVDVISGSLIGVLTAYIFYIWVFRWEKPWLDVSLGRKILKTMGK